MLGPKDNVTVDLVRRSAVVRQLCLAIFLALAVSAWSPWCDIGYPFDRERSQTGSPVVMRQRYYCNYEPDGALDELSCHRLDILRRGRAPAAATARDELSGGLAAQDVSGIAVISDDGTMVIPASRFDLKNSSVMFTPDGNRYRVSAADVQFNKDFGSRIGYFLGADGRLNENADNGYRDIDLGGAQFPFFGVRYETAYVGTNGYITFTQGDTSARISPTLLARDLPRIAPLWADLEIDDSGDIYYNRLDGAHLFTWNRAGQPLYSGVSTFQAELYDDGRIAFIYKKVKAHASLIGISPGLWEGDPQPLDFSSPPVAAIGGPVFETFAKEQRLDLPALLGTFYRSHPDSFDALYIWTDFDYDNGLGIARSFNVRNDIKGIGLKIADRGAAYGSPSRLSTIITMGNEANWPREPDAHVIGLNSAVSIVCHELGHRWLAYVRFAGENGIRDDLLGRDNSHWSFLVDSRTNDSGGFSSLMEGNSWRGSGGNTYTTIESAVNYFSPLDQYLMGLRSAGDVGEIQYLEPGATLRDFLRERSPVSGFSLTAAPRTISIAKIVEQEGPRIPDVSQAPKEFRVGFILLTGKGSAASGSTLNKLAGYRDSLVGYFFTATGGLGSLDSSLE